MKLNKKMTPYMGIFMNKNRGFFQNSENKMRIKKMNFLDVMSEHWAINVEQVSHINIHIDQNTIFLYINGAEEPSIRIECANEKAAQSFFTLWKMRINDSKEKKERKAK